MAAAIQARNTSQYAGEYLVLPVKAATIIFAGTLVAIDATGHAIPAKKAADLIAAGRAEDTADNKAGSDGDLTVKVARGTFRWDNDATNAVTAVHVLKPCYIADDGTVCSLETGSSAAGKVLGVDADGVIVETR